MAGNTLRPTTRFNATDLIPAMIPIGYLYKQVARRPDWLKADQVDDIYSLSGCESEDFADYINFWRHNGYWLFDSPQIIEALAREQKLSLAGMTLFYYEAFESEYDDKSARWRSYRPVSDFVTKVVPPEGKNLEGFDVTSFSVGTSPECSPLSCNALAETIPTNRHCLFNTFDEARQAIETGQFERCEEGPYRIIAVYRVDQGAGHPTGASV